MVDPRRVRILKEAPLQNGPVLYWMSRDQRASENWALLFAQELAIARKVPLLVCFCLVPHYLGASDRHYQFLLQGLQEVEARLQSKGIPFVLLRGEPGVAIPRFCDAHSVGALVCDFSPLKPNREWKTDVAKKAKTIFYEVDAHNVVPCWIASNKLEFAARTIRPKITRLLRTFLTPYPALKKHPFPSARFENEWSPPNAIYPGLPRSGEKAAKKTLQGFLKQRLNRYDPERNNPAINAQSDLSPYLHFGQISAQLVAWSIRKSGGSKKSRDTFIEELVIRRELSDNFCYYNPHYDSFEGFPKWAKETLNRHRQDPRPFLYTRDQFEKAQTHDRLWNAAQNEMVFGGKMHGYMRMYWAKKILEWSVSPEEAIETAIFLNDRYELDGRDPNGYAGIAWSIGGVHDRPWFERPIFGTIRFMSYNGCKSKFPVEDYIRRVQALIP